MNRWLATIQPLDVWSVRDGRPFDANAASVGRAAAVPPTTATGAITAALQQSHGRRIHPRQVVGPFVIDRTPAGFVPYLPSPLDVVRDEATAAVGRLRWDASQITSDLSDQGGLDIAAPSGQGTPAGGWMGPSSMRRYLHGDTFSPGEGPEVLTEDLITTETRVQVQPGVDKMLARHQVQRFVRSSLCFGAIVTLPDDIAHPPPTLARFGGEAREAVVSYHPVTADLDAMLLPPLEPEEGDTDVLACLVTPGAFGGSGWLPALAYDVAVVAATVGGPLPVASGTPGKWTLRWCAAPGSVYRLRFPNTEALRTFASVEGPTLRSRTFRQAHHDLRSAGFGAFILGRIPA